MNAGCDAVRPSEARRGGGIDIAKPRSGVRYAELPLDRPDSWETLTFVTRQRGRLCVPMAVEFRGFFEHWLKADYLRQLFKSRGQGVNEEGGAWMVGFPMVVYTVRRRPKVAPLFSFPLADLQWLDAGGQAWEAPTWRARQAKHLPPPPESVLMQARRPGQDKDDPPLRVNLSLLARVFGMGEEAIGALLLTLREAPDQTPGGVVDATIAALLALGQDGEPDIEMPAGTPAEAPNETPDDTPDETRDDTPAETLTWAERLTRLHHQCAPWLGASGAQLKPTAILFDGAAGSPTARLEQELDELVDGERHWQESAALSRYLTVGPQPRGSKRGTKLRHRSDDAPMMCGLLQHRPLTAPQRAAVERGLQGPLTAVQGPPGTGKTYLIGQTAAHILVTAARRGIYGPRLPLRDAPQLVVTSTNNRAVDNVLDPLTTQFEAGRLALGLRGGSRIVHTTRTAAELGRVIQWIKSAPVVDDDALVAAQKAFRAASDAFDAHTAELSAERQWHASWDAATAQRNDANEALRACPAAPSAREVGGQASGELGGESGEAALLESLPALRRARIIVNDACIGAEVLLDQVIDDRGVGSSKKIRRRCKPLMKKVVKVGERLATSQLPWTPWEPPVGGGQDPMLAWEESLTTLVDQLETASDLLEARIAPIEKVRKARDAVANQRARLATAEEALIALGVRPAPVDEAALRESSATLDHQCYQTAQTLREAWAAYHRDELLRYCRALERACMGSGFVPQVVERHGVATFRALFPVVGCTLLSMGNVFPFEPGACDMVVIDEAGQCLPPYAVSALFRARRCLVVGDVNQLEPVVMLPEHQEVGLRRRLGSPLDAAVMSRVRIAQLAPGSTQRLAEAACGRRMRLTDHYRCQPQIIQISNALCDYRLKIHTPPASLVRRVPHLRAPVMMLPVYGVMESRWGSWRNQAEAERVVSLVRHLLSRGISTEDIGVLTPYRAQTTLLARRLGDAGILVEGGDELAAASDQGQLFGRRAPLALGTVHRFQGGERQVVILTTVVSEPARLGWLNRAPNLINVAASRARTHLLVLGNPEVLDTGEYTKVVVAAVPAEGWLAPRQA